MSAFAEILAWLLPGLYLVAGVNYALLFFRGSSLARRTVTPVLVVTALVHLVAIGLRSASAGRCPLADFSEVLSLLAFAVVVVYLILETHQRNPYTGMFLLSLVMPLALASVLVGHREGPVSELLRTAWFGFHTTFALLGYAAFAVSAVYAFMFLLLHRALKRRTFGLVFDRLPPLEVLGRMTLGAALIGFVALTLAMGIGVAWGARVIKGFWADPKLHLTLLVWAVYGLGLLGRLVFKLPNRRMAIVFLTGFAVAVVVVVMLNTILQTFHTFSARGPA